MKDKVKISEAKGRPMLKWVGKTPIDYVRQFPAQLVEIFSSANSTNIIDDPTFDNLQENWQNLLFHGDNMEVLGYLIANGFRSKIDLIYIDPPFDSKADYVRKIELRGIKEKARIEGEKYSIGEQIQYTDIWSNDMYLQFLYERLLLLKELLSETGSIYVHCDSHQVHYIKVIMDEIFGRENFKSEIIWQRTSSHTNAFRNYGVINDTILFYTKSTEYTWNEQYTPYTEEQIKNRFKPDDNGKLREKHSMLNPASASERPNLTYEWHGHVRTWLWGIDKMRELEKDGKLEYSSTGYPYLVYNLEDMKGMILQNIWTDIIVLQNIWTDVPNVRGNIKTGYPTQKPEKLLKRIIESSSKENDIILDCFIGSGTTAKVSQQLNRRWIGCDINKGAIQTTIKRVGQVVKDKEREMTRKKNKKIDNFNNVIFAHYKVNDYDLQILRTEATELAIQHLGIQRLKSDMFFDGILGNNIVKIIDFNHPLTLLDLQLIQDELKKRPKEDRNVTIVALGKEYSTDPWIEEYNKKHPVNKLEVIELRTDKKYGKFLTHNPSEGKVEIRRRGGKAIIKIRSFISHSIIDRLNEPGTLINIKIKDFRSMIDAILIDTDYDGKVFNIKYSDMPENRNDLVEGNYEIDISEKKRFVAVKIIDMLGEEVLVSKEI